jgi:ABC-type nitrate/sulfonate/bicarbonate transport system permease component
MDTAGVMAGVVILSVIGVIFHYSLQWLRDRLLFWAEQGEVAGPSV